LRLRSGALNRGIFPAEATAWKFAGGSLALAVFWTALLLDRAVPRAEPSRKHRRTGKQQEAILQPTTTGKT
jgi:hypothetical protein